RLGGQFLRGPATLELQTDIGHLPVHRRPLEAKVFGCLPNVTVMCTKCLEDVSALPITTGSSKLRVLRHDGHSSSSVCVHNTTYRQYATANGRSGFRTTINYSYRVKLCQAASITINRRP